MDNRSWEPDIQTDDRVRIKGPYLQKRTGTVEQAKTVFGTLAEGSWKRYVVRLDEGEKSELNGVFELGADALGKLE